MQRWPVPLCVVQVLPNLRLRQTTSTVKSRHLAYERCTVLWLWRRGLSTWTGYEPVSHLVIAHPTISMKHATFPRRQYVNLPLCIICLSTTLTVNCMVSLWHEKVSRRKTVKILIWFVIHTERKQKYNQPMYMNFALRKGVGPYSGVGNVSGFYGRSIEVWRFIIFSIYVHVFANNIIISILSHSCFYGQ